ncbi:MAG: ASCH domain-containing protein [bacterium]
MSLFAEPFERIKSGRKVIEVRLFDEKRQKVGIGDTIIFKRLPKRDESITAKVVGLSRFGSFRDLFSAFDKSKFGHPENFTLEGQIAGMREAYSKEREKELGVLGIHIKLTDKTL